MPNCGVFRASILRIVAVGGSIPFSWVLGLYGDDEKVRMDLHATMWGSRMCLKSSREWWGGRLHVFHYGYSL